METQKTLNNQNYLRKMKLEESGSLTSDCTYSKAIVIKTVRYQHKSKCRSMVKDGKPMHLWSPHLTKEIRLYSDLQSPQ